MNGSPGCLPLHVGCGRAGVQVGGTSRLPSRGSVLDQVAVSHLV